MMPRAMEEPHMKVNTYCVGGARQFLSLLFEH